MENDGYDSGTSVGGCYGFTHSYDAVSVNGIRLRARHAQARRSYVESGSDDAISEGGFVLEFVRRGSATASSGNDVAV